MIQDGAPDFERIRHGHAVHLHQHVARQIGGGLEIERLEQHIRAGGQQAVGKGLHQVGAVGGKHPLGPQQALADEVRGVVRFEIALQRGRPGDHAQIVLAISRVRQGIGKRTQATAYDARQPVRPAQPFLQEEAIVASEQFIAAIAAQRDFHVLDGELRDDVSGDGGGIAERLVEVPHQFGQQVQRVGLDHGFEVLRFIALGHQPRIWQLVELGLLESDRECLDRFLGLQCHGCHHRAGIDSAAQKRT